jgi:hypothetical protein
MPAVDSQTRAIAGFFYYRASGDRKSFWNIFECVKTQDCKFILRVIRKIFKNCLEQRS